MPDVFSLETEQNVKIGYSTEGHGEKILLLIHGYPQTSLAWRRMIQPLTEAGFKLIIPDMRGAGRSSRPVCGYDKKTLASDMVSILNEQQISGPVYVAGHDIGMMVAFAMGAFSRSVLKSWFLWRRQFRVRLVLILRMRMIHVAGTSISIRQEMFRRH